MLTHSGKTLSPVKVSTCTDMSKICRSALRPGMRRQPSDVSLHVSSTLRGMSADSGWTPPRPRLCSCTSGVGRSTARHITLVVRASGSHRMEFKIAILVYLSLPGMTPAYLVAGCQLVSDEGRRKLRPRRGRVLSDGLQQLWRQMFCTCRSKTVEQLCSWSARSWR